MSISSDGEHLQNEDASVSVSAKTGGWKFDLKGALQINLSATHAADSNNGIVGIYGDPKGLLQLADLLIAVAKIDQTRLPDQNCPPQEGMHVTLYGAGKILSGDIDLNIGRLDSKGDGSLNWLSADQQVMIFKDESD